MVSARVDLSGGRGNGIVDEWHRVASEVKVLRPPPLAVVHFACLPHRQHRGLA